MACPLEIPSVTSMTIGGCVAVVAAVYCVCGVALKLLGEPAWPGRLWCWSKEAAERGLSECYEPW